MDGWVDDNEEWNSWKLVQKVVFYFNLRSNDLFLVLGGERAKPLIIQPGLNWMTQTSSSSRGLDWELSNHATTSGGSNRLLFEWLYLSVLVDGKQHQSLRPSSPNAPNEMSTATVCFHFNLIKTRCTECACHSLDTWNTFHMCKKTHSYELFRLYILNSRNTINIVNAPTYLWSKQIVMAHLQQPMRLQKGCNPC